MGKKYKLRALRGSLIIEQDATINETDAGIIIKNDVRTFRTGTVVSVGSECYNYQVIASFT